MKRIIAVLLAAVLVVGGLSGVAYAQEEPVNQVKVDFWTSWNYAAPGDVFTNGDVVGGKEEWAVFIHKEPDETGAPISATVSLDTELEFDGVGEENLTKMGPPIYEWSCNDIPEESGCDGTWVWVGFDSPNVFPVTFRPGFDASRSADIIEFSGSAIQNLTIKVTPRDVTEIYEINVETWKDELVDAVIVSPTTDEEQGIWLAEDQRYLWIWPKALETDTTYTYNVTIEVTPKVPGIVEFMPTVAVQWHEIPNSGTTEGDSVSYRAGDSADVVGTWTCSTEGSYVWDWDEVIRRLVIFPREIEIGPHEPIIESLVATPEYLWPPNHKAVDVALTVDATDPNGPEDIVRTTYSVADEYGVYDVVETDLPEDEIISLIAERDGKDKDGRIYTITVTVYDAGGLSDSRSVDVVVPHNWGKMPTLLRLQTWLGPNDPLMEPLRNFAEAVEQRSDYSVRIELYPGDGLVPFGELAEAIEQGTVEMGLIHTFQLRDDYPVMDAGELPFLYNDNDGLMAAVQGGIGELLSQELTAHNITVLDWTTCGFFHLFNRQVMLDDQVVLDHPLIHPVDVVGRNIRAYGMQAEAITAWGGNPLWKSLEEIYTALDRGELDGVTNFLYIYDAYCLFEVAPYVCVDYAFGNLAGLCINSKVWKRLDGKTKDIMTEAAGDYIDEMLVTVKDVDAEALQRIEGYEVEVCTLTDEERAIWREASRPVWDAWVEAVGDVGYQIIDIALEHNPLP